MKAVVSGAPFHVTAVVFVNPVPFAVRVNPGPPAITLAGEMLVRDSGPVIVNGNDAGTGDPVTLTATVSGTVRKFDGMTAVNCVLETNVVAKGVPFQVMIVPVFAVSAPPMNPEPLTVSVNPGLPAATEVGERLVNVIGCEVLIEKLRAFDVTLPHCAVIDAVPCCAIRLAGTVAVIWVAFTTVVESAAPFHRTLVPLMKPEPLTVSVNEGPPVVAEEGERFVSVRLSVTVKVKGEGETCPGTVTPTEAVPAVATRFAGTDAVNCDAERKFVVRAWPFQVIVAPLTNPVPLAVRVNPALPDATVFGEMLVSVTGTAVIVNAAAFEVSPRACAVMDADPG